MIKERFILDRSITGELADMVPVFGELGEIVFYRTYSRGNESWFDVVKRVVEGTFSIRKDFYIRNYINWDESFWQHYARQFAKSLFKMEWFPPGRGLWAMGTLFVYKRGSMALTNCGLVVVGSDIGDAANWAMDALMLGVGVGFVIDKKPVQSFIPTGDSLRYTIPDSREGWCRSVEMLINNYLRVEQPWSFDYSAIRGTGEPIKGFGGTASGPEPLKELHERIRETFRRYHDREFGTIRLKADIMNSIAVCVIAGNVRRSAEIAMCEIDTEFLNLKDGSRPEIDWTSNNSVLLTKDSDFERMDEIADRVERAGEPGIINLRNLACGRLGKDDGLRPDLAVGCNPCGEIGLEDRELCCLAETLPTRCSDPLQWLKACEYATVYASTVTLLPTHQPITNAVIARNRRIGIGIIDVSGWKHDIGVNQVIKWLRQGYSHIRKVNKWINAEAGVPEAIKVTTIKPGGSVPKLAGRTPGIGHPTFKWTLRRIRVAKNAPITVLLIGASYPHETDVTDPGTWVFEIPLKQGPAKPASEVTVWEQAMNVIMMQREWSDNAVSNTLYFKPEEAHDIEALLSAIAPQIKSVSLLPHTPEGAYKQMPEEGITEEEYHKRVGQIQSIDWEELRGNISEPEIYCDSEKCQL